MNELYERRLDLLEKELGLNPEREVVYFGHARSVLIGTPSERAELRRLAELCNSRPSLFRGPQ
jgi:hypothetical protein